MKLRIKLPLVYTMLIAALGAAFVVFTSRLVQEHRVEEEQEYFQSLAEALAMSTASAIRLRDSAALRDFVDRVAHAARILAVADTFDSMTAERPYRTTPGKARALEEIRRHAGTQFDPKVVEAFLRTEPPVAPPPDENNPVAAAIRGQEML